MADGQTESLDRVQAFPLVATTPHLQHRFLHDVLSLRRILCDAERHPEEFVLQRQHVGLETV